MEVRGARGDDDSTCPLTGLLDVAAPAGADSGRILAVDEALDAWRREDPDAAAMVRLRPYAGPSVEDGAAAMGLSPRTAARLWIHHRADLSRDLRPDS